MHILKLVFSVKRSTKVYNKMPGSTLASIIFQENGNTAHAPYLPTVLEFKDRLELKSSKFHHIISSKVKELHYSNCVCTYNYSI